MHKTCLVSLALGALAAVAYADSSPELPVNSPPECVQSLQGIPAVRARIAAGNCLARKRLSLVPVTAPTLETANSLATAVAPSIALFDNVIALGDPYWSMIAEGAKRDTYESMAVRLRSAVQPGDELDRIKAEMLVANWEDNVALSNVRVAALAEKHPDAARRDPQVMAVVEQATTGNVPQVATRRR